MYDNLMEIFKIGDIKKRLLIKTFGLENKRIISCVILFKISIYMCGIFLSSYHKNIGKKNTYIY
jgi:hypothetical protein